MLDEKLVLVDDDGKLLKKVDSPVSSDSDSELEDVFNETLETYDEDRYDNDDYFNDCGLTEASLKYPNAFDISLHGQIR
ncbi:hypothetical protein Tco_0033263 [Tanacetum coccineum]